MTDLDDAREFHASFQPRDGSKYDWVVALAKQRFEASRAAFKGIDEKAAHLMTYLGSGAGVAIAASVAGVTAGQVHPLVAAGAVPSFVFALRSLTFAARCRGPHPSYPPPTAASAARLADAGPLGEAAMIPAWNLAAVENDAVVSRKAATLTRAVGSLVAAVWLLLLPLAVGIGVRCHDWATTATATATSPTTPR